ncbi:MAG: hypothetical protein RDU20_22935 [Desulfomonilaceae bacterium]|nr:hypothetical protein [Desulfomonilaceae bacterium]
MDETKRRRIIERRNQIRREAIEKLRESGLILVAQASDIKIQVIADRVEWSYIDGTLTYVIDGTDISDAVRGLNVQIRPGDFPTDTIILRQKPVLVRGRKSDAE